MVNPDQLSPTEFATLVAALTAVVALVWQIRQEIRSMRQKELAVKRAAKMKIISDLVAYRFVLTDRGSGQDLQEAKIIFDTALSRIPIDFIEHEEVLDRYKKLGTNFTPEKYYELIKTMLEAAGHIIPECFTIDLLKTVPIESVQR